MPFLGKECENCPVIADLKVLLENNVYNSVTNRTFPRCAIITICNKNYIFNIIGLVKLLFLPFFKLLSFYLCT